MEKEKTMSKTKDKRITQADTSLSMLIQCFDEAKEAINKEYYQGILEPVVFTLEPNKGNTNYLGYFTPSTNWNVKGTSKKYHQITIITDKLNRSLIEVLTTLCHELVHLYCHQKGIKDTSRGGKWHNVNFKEQAESHGLFVEKSESIGFSKTTPKPELVKWFKSLPKWKEWEKALHLWFDEVEPVKKVANKKSHRIQYICPDCHTKITCTKEQNLICGNCTEDTNTLVYFVKLES